MENKLNKDQIYQVIKALTGEVAPTGQSHIDKDRLKNLELYIEVFNVMYSVIGDIPYDYDNHKEASIKRIVERCRRQLEEMSIED